VIPLRRRTIAWAALALACGVGPATAEVLSLEAVDVRRVLQHGPWPPPPTRDPSNRVSGNPSAVALGQRLFFDARLSGGGGVSCASCHEPARAWTDGRKQAVGLVTLERNTPSILNVAQQRWFSWDGGADSLWSQTMRPIVDPREMGASPRHVRKLIADDPALSCLYGKAYGRLATAEADDERVLVNVGKALAAFVEGVSSGRTPFDEFRDALARGDRETAGRYPVAAQRGLKIFVGRGNCSLCHFGPAFTNGEFHDVGVPFLVQPGKVDAGRHGGIKRLKADRFNLLGPYSDDAGGASATKTRHVALQHTTFGQFKTPSLRNVALTAPYMHDGRYDTLRHVVRHYSELDMERIHADGERLLRPLKLSDAESEDLVAFLESLTAPDAAALPPTPRGEGCGS
jgi:cytochrome c peroxidase